MDAIPLWGVEFRSRLWLVLDAGRDLEHLGARDGGKSFARELGARTAADQAASAGESLGRDRGTRLGSGISTGLARSLATEEPTLLGRRPVACGPAGVAIFRNERRFRP